MREALGKALVAACCVVSAYALAPGQWILVSVLAVLVAFHHWSRNPDRTFVASCAIAILAVGFVSVRSIVVTSVILPDVIGGVADQRSPANAEGTATVRRGHHGPSAHEQQAVEDDPVLGGATMVYVVDPRIELVSRTYHLCGPDETAELVFVLRADPGEDVDFASWSISFVNELDNSTHTIENVTHHEHLSPTVATVTHAVKGPGVFKFREHGEESTGQHCPIHRHSGTALVLVHDPPTVNIVRHDCEGPVVAVFSGSPPFRVTTSNGLEVVESSVALPTDNATMFYELRDAYCTSKLDLVAHKPVRSEAHVQRDGEDAVVHMQSAGQPPVVLSFWKTNVSLTSFMLPPRVDAKVHVEVRQVEGGASWILASVKDSVPGATSLRQPPGWLPPASAVPGDVARNLQPLFGNDCTLLSQRQWSSFLLVSLQCSGGKESLAQIYLTCNSGYNLLQRLESSDIDVVRPFRCQAPVKENEVLLEEVSPERMSDITLSSRQVEEFCGRRYSVFGLVSVAACGQDCAVAKVHVGDGNALLVRLFRACSGSVRWSSWWEILALRSGGVVSDKVPFFNCSAVDFDTSRKALLPELEQSPLYSKIATKTSLVECRGLSSAKVNAVARVQEENHVVFVSVGNGVVVRLEQLRGDEWAAVSMMRNAESGYIDFFLSGEPCAALPASVVKAGDDWAIPIAKLQPLIEASTGDRYECLRVTQAEAAAGGAVSLRLVSGSSSDCRKSSFSAPAPASELVSMRLTEETTRIALEPHACLTFGHLRDQACDGHVNQLQLCGFAKREDPVFLPTLVINGGARGLKPGQSATVSIYMSGEGPFSFDLLLNRQVLRRESNIAQHLLNFEERGPGIYAVENFRSRSQAGVVSGKAEITFIRPPEVSLMAVQAPCPGKQLEFDILVDAEDGDEKFAIRWTYEGTDAVQEVIMASGTKRVSVANAGTILIAGAKRVKSGEDVAAVRMRRLNVAYRAVSHVRISDFSPNVCAGTNNGFATLYTEGGDSFPLRVELQNGQVVVVRTPLQRVEELRAGSYALKKATDFHGCDAQVDTNVVTIGQFEVPCCHLVGVAKEHYVGEHIELQCRAGGAPFVVSYARDGQAGRIRIPSLAGVMFQLDKAGAYRFSQTVDGNGCSARVGGFGDETCAGPAPEIVVSEYPSASLEGDAYYCEGSKASLRIKVQGGRGPWNVELAADDGPPQKIVVDDAVKALLVGEGNYSLRSVCDVHGTQGRVDGLRVVITEKKLPSARFVSKDNLCYIPHLKNRSLALQLLGSAPFSFDASGKHHSGVLESVVSLDVTNHGMYPVANLRDAYCASSGTVAETQVREMPRVHIAADESVICSGEEAKITFVFSGGLPPYRLHFTADGNAERVEIVSGSELTIGSTQGARYYVTALSDRHCFYARAQM